MATYEWHGGDTVVRLDDTPERWVITWDLGVVRVAPRGKDENFDSVFSALDVDGFRLEFANQEEVIHFKAEIQRYRSNLLSNLATELEAFFNDR
jgi:hypothetical protein